MDIILHIKTTKKESDVDLKYIELVHGYNNDSNIA